MDAIMIRIFWLSFGMFLGFVAGMSEVEDIEEDDYDD